MQKYVILAIKFSILGLILYWISRSFDEDDWQSLLDQPKNWLLLVVSLIVVLVAHAVSFIRWAVFVHELGVPFGWLESLRLGFLGNLFNFVSFGAVGGDVFKAVAAARQVPGKRPEVVASVLVDRALGLLGLVLVAAVSLEFMSGDRTALMSWIRGMAWLLTAVGIGALAMVTLIGHHLPTHLLRRIPIVGKTLYRMASAGMLFEKRPGLVCRLLGLSCVVHVMLTFGVYLISIALYEKTPSLGDHFVTIPPALAVAALPIAPAGIGVQEAAIDTIFRELPSTPTSFSGLIVAIFYRIELVIVAAIGGIFYILAAKDIQRDLEEAAHAND